MHRVSICLIFICEMNNELLKKSGKDRGIFVRFFVLLAQNISGYPNNLRLHKGGWQLNIFLRKVCRRWKEFHNE